MAESDGWLYIYTPLKHYASIRILELLPGREGSPLACSLKEVNKNDVSYEALSYAWGAPIFSKSIREVTFDTVIPVTENLYEALQVLRSEVTPRILWIDALCINQSDLKEKGHQVVPLEIFRDAVCCLNRYLDKPAGSSFADRYPINLKKQINRTSCLFEHRDKRISKTKAETSTNSPELRQTILQCFLALTRGRICSNSRDYVYAILGLGDDHLGVIPDYSLSARQTFRNFALRCLLAGETSVLHESGFHPDRSHDEPSFAPIVTFGGTKTLPLNTSKWTFQAATNSSVKADAITDGKVSIKGVRVDTIVAVGIFTPELPNSPGEVVSRMFEYEFAEVLVRGPFRWANLAFKDWIMGSMRDRDWNDDGALYAEEEDDLNTLWAPPPYGHLLMSDLFVQLITLENRNCTKPPTTLGRFRQYWTRPNMKGRPALRNRVIFKTQTGYLGVGSRWTREGDQVVIFDGFKTPFTLRREPTGSDTDDSVWRLIGDCYLMGWMHGDYFGHEVVDELPLQTNDEGQGQKEDKKVLVKTSFVLR
ncbi:hypothetical protein N0V83_009010 [Neocucurbitaria cava]|uniref:Heterokaryon incompatibility domain-containing protein n=1 Tax=Neocucurbitaria cava TaxID=798079 RepID=A0A9W8Y1X1_9PLEO|nr:hypothetical protein N0V83_009010 [Neocucurbitaria cava]